MRHVLLVAAIGLAAGLIGGPQVASQDRSGAVDLFERNLKDWSRTGTGTNPWRLTVNSVLICERGVTEQYIPERLFGDGTLTFEFMFPSTGAKTGYKGAILVRKPQDGPGVRIDLGDDCGALTAMVAGSSDREKKLEDRPAAPVAQPAGEWNTVEIAFEGRSIVVTVNGKPGASLGQCDLESGLIALCAEGSQIHFKNMQWREAK